MLLPTDKHSVTVVSILRLRSLVGFAKSENPTWDNADVSNWSTIEVCVGIICTCMPSLRLILARVSPTIFGGSSARAYTHYPDHEHNYAGPDGQRNNSRTIRSIALVSTTHSHKNQNTLTTITTDDPLEPSTMSDMTTGTKKLSATEDAQGIMYSKSYAVEYGSEYNDQARLVDNNAASESRMGTSNTNKSADRNDVDKS